MRVFGVSRDSFWSHRAWKESLGVDVTLLSDWNGSLQERLGAGRTWRSLEGVPERATFLLAQGGTVRQSWRYADSEVPDFDEVLEAVRASSR